MSFIGKILLILIIFNNQNLNLNKNTEQQSECHYPHPPNIEQIEGKIKVNFEQDEKGMWLIVINIKYRNGKRWKGEIPTTDIDLLEAVRTYERWKIHIINTVHYKDK